MITVPVFIIIFIIFIAWTQYEMKKGDKAERKAHEEFLAREYEANHTAKKDFSDIPVLRFDESVIPLPEEGQFTENDDVTGYIESLRSLIKEPMMDLSSYSNTDLKLSYGTANFTLLSGYDANYSNFLMLLTNLARAYERRKMYDLAEKSYKAAIQCGSVKLNDYTALAGVYLKKDDPAAINSLIEEVQASDIERKEGIAEALKRELAKY